MLHEIVVACLEYQPTFSLFRRQLTYQDAFSGEISRVSRDIDQCYKGFRNDLGKSDDRFLDSFRTATTSLLDIDDVLNELTMIKRVYQNQAQVWEDLHKDRTLSMKCRCSPDQAPRRLYTVMTRLEEDAQKVRESVVTLLQLTQGSASTENALKASEQSKILAIFTVVTVIFVSDAIDGDFQQAEKFIDPAVMDCGPLCSQDREFPCWGDMDIRTGRRWLR
ncbi:hypothetical protein F5883DRAFT_27102 [Diaporthe sp. PMI_573]|nr:hypothetical protein F5883DRAFT_27102 [Diaporthaceae sp. PMI_573]